MKKLTLLLILFFIPFLGVAKEPPLAKDVFQISTKMVDPNTFRIEWTIKKGFFLYKARLKLTEPLDSNFHLGSINLPKALIHHDAQGTKYFIYRDHIAWSVSILGEAPGEALLNVHYQGCSDDGFCYPPETSQLKLVINKQLALTNVSLEMYPKHSIHPTKMTALNNCFLRITGHSSF
jgi:thiol:disulfide interchange protein DsbD